MDARFDRTEHGDTEVFFRTIFRKVPQNQWKDVAQGVSFASGFGGTVSDVTTASPTDLDNPFHFSYTYNRKDFGGDWSNRRITPPIPMILLPGPKNEDEKPKEPIWLGSPRRIQSQTRLKLPTGYAPTLPANTDIERDFAEYHSSYLLHRGDLIIRLTFLTKLAEVPVEQYDLYRSLRKRMEDDRDRYIQLSTGSSALQDAARQTMVNRITALPETEDPKALECENEAGNMKTSVEAFKCAVAADPGFVRAWIMLGQDYAESRQMDSAVDAYRHAIIADPKQPVPYELLGTALMASSKDDEATKVWQQLIALDPTNENGPANLASALFSLKRYSEAASAYESATKLAPESAALQMGLGISYLRANNETSASSAFQKAMALSPGADMQNTVAYELAEADKQLPLALEYAQKAVQSVEETSKKIDIAILKTADLSPTQQLGAYWDTLGWVYFKMDNLSAAESFLRAAWTLSLDAISGDHLGQLYEKQHKRDAAIHMYQLALSANPKLEETKLRLAKLQGDLVNHSRDLPGAELSTLRTIKLPRFTTANGSSEIFVLISPDRIEGVHFLSGSDKVKPTKAMFSPASFKSEFPSISSAFLLRRGILSCFQITGCSLVVYPPDSVHSIN